MFERNSDSKHVHEKLLEEFPQLSNCGGYEILRTSVPSEWGKKIEGYNESLNRQSIVCNRV